MMKASDSHPGSGFLHHEEGHDEDVNGMTLSRRIARYLSRFSWYYPQQKGGPSLEKAWFHYEHVTLARCYENHHDRFENDFVRARQSERHLPTRLYPVLATPLKELADFGVSQRMFFSTLLVLAGIMFLAGTLNIPMMIYFWGYAGDDSKQGVDYMGTSTIRGSALCDATEWVQCQSCQEHPDEYPSYRLDGVNVRRNICDFDDWLVPGLCSFASTLLLLVLMAVAFWKQRAAEVVFDEDVQTPSDYTVKVTNPPPDATNPDEWQQFFNQYAPADGNGGVVLVTIALNNAKLIKATMERRSKIKELAKLLPLGTDMNDRALVMNLVLLSNDSWLSKLTCGLVVPSAKQLWGSIQNIEDEIRALSQEQYKAISVFVTFDTERAQRNALHALSTGRLRVWRNQLDPHKFGEDGVLRVFETMERTSMWSLPSEPTNKQRMSIRLTASTRNGGGDDDNTTGLLMFRNYHVLNVREAQEPSDVRWSDLQVSYATRIQQFAGSAIGMMIFVMWSGFFIFRLVKNYPGEYATAFITMTNVAVPAICELVNNFEYHPTEHGSQISLYVKITLFRWFNSAIALSLISSFVESISVEDGMEQLHESLIYKVYPVIVAELFFKPVYEILDPPENLRKHVLAPRARDQEEMNACFSGGRFWLAERYTDINKVLFVALFFSTLLPEAFLLGSLALLAQFFVSKFVLLRHCGPTPDCGFYLSRLSRNYFIPFVLVTHVVMSAYWWSGYPYDNVCENTEYGGYSYCAQNFWANSVFPPLPRFQPDETKWMTESQELLTSLFAWTSVVVVFVAVVAIVHAIIPKIRGLFESTYEPDGADQGIDFTSVMHLDEIHAYIPQVRVKGVPFPMLACDISAIDENLLAWRDDLRGYDVHNLIHDVHAITRSKPLHPIFSIVKQFDPKVPLFSLSESQLSLGASQFDPPGLSPKAVPELN